MLYIHFNNYLIYIVYHPKHHPIIHQILVLILLISSGVICLNKKIIPSTFSILYLPLINSKNPNVCFLRINKNFILIF